MVFENVYSDHQSHSVGFVFDLGVTDLETQFVLRNEVFVKTDPEEPLHLGDQSSHVFAAGLVLVFDLAVTPGDLETQFVLRNEGHVFVKTDPEEPLHLGDHSSHVFAAGLVLGVS